MPHYEIVFARVVMWDISAQHGSGRWVDEKVPDFFRQCGPRGVFVYLYYSVTDIYGKRELVWKEGPVE